MVWSLVSAPVWAEESYEEKLAALRDVSEQQPMRVEDAEPSEGGVDVEVSLLNLSEDGGRGLIAMPQVAVGFEPGLELGLGWQAGVLDHELELGGAQIYGLWRFLKATGPLPSIAIKSTLNTPSGDQGVGGELGLRISEIWPRSRLHANGSYRVQHDAPGRAWIGVGADRVLVADRWMVMADAYLEKLKAQHPSEGADLGIAVRLAGNFRLNAAAGMVRIHSHWLPRLLIGFAVG